MTNDATHFKVDFASLKWTRLWIRIINLTLVHCIPPCFISSPSQPGLGPPCALSPRAAQPLCHQLPGTAFRPERPLREVKTSSPTTPTQIPQMIHSTIPAPWNPIPLSHTRRPASFRQMSRTKKWHATMCCGWGSADEGGGHCRGFYFYVTLNASSVVTGAVHILTTRLQILVTVWKKEGVSSLLQISLPRSITSSRDYLCCGTPVFITVSSRKASDGDSSRGGQGTRVKCKWCVVTAGLMSALLKGVVWHLCADYSKTDG